MLLDKNDFFLIEYERGSPGSVDCYPTLGAVILTWCETFEKRALLRQLGP